MSAFLPVNRCHWQSVATGFCGADFRIAFGLATRNHGPRSSALPNPAPVFHSSTASPSYRSGVSTAGPTFASVYTSRNGQDIANARVRVAKLGFFPFPAKADGLSSRAIKTLIRGSSSSCSRKTQSSPFFWPLALPVACPPRKSAALPVLSSAQPLPMPPTKTWSLVRPLARLQALPPVASNWACRPAPRATDLTLTAAPLRGPDLTPRPFRAAVRGGLFACQSAPARAD